MHESNHTPSHHPPAQGSEPSCEIHEKRERIARLLGALLARKWLAERVHDAAEVQTAAPGVGGLNTASDANQGDHASRPRSST
jgi:hypothetical protein